MRRALRSWSGRVGLTLTVLVLLFAIVGPAFAPHPPNAVIGIPFATPSGRFPLGTDFVGRDVLSRVLYGGRSLIVLAGLATLIAYVIGGAIGLTSGYRRSIFDSVSIRVDGCSSGVSADPSPPRHRNGGRCQSCPRWSPASCSFRFLVSRGSSGRPPRT